MHILSVLPQLFFLSPLATTLLRIAAAVVFAKYAYFAYSHRKELSAVPVMIVGSGMWIPMISSIFATVVAACLFLGLYTQLAAIGGAVAALKMLIWHRRYHMFVPFSRTTCGLLLVICLSLIITGAGAFAFDLPL